MNGRPLVIITTRLPPATCGVGAHSALLRKHWPQTSAPVEFLVVDGAAEATPIRDGDRITQFNGSGADLTRELDRIGPADVVLHYAGRAYDRFGCPLWLPGALAKWRRKFPGRLLVFVHEVPGDLAITSRHFWLGKLNAWILRRLVSAADVVLTNTEEHRTKLRNISRREDIHLVPVGSNIENVGGATPRLRTEFVLFGLPFGRWQTLRMFDRDIRRWQANGQLTKLHIIGPGGDEFTRQADELIKGWANGEVAIQHGVLPSTDVSKFLHRAQFALTNVNLETWSKSGAFMACAANDCAPVIRLSNRTTVPLSYAVRSDEVEMISESDLQRRADALHAWYRENADWPVVTARLAALLGGENR